MSDRASKVQVVRHPSGWFAMRYQIGQRWFWRKHERSGLIELWPQFPEQELLNLSKPDASQDIDPGHWESVREYDLTKHIP